ncbi:hypothetical protein Pfo_021971 [Paulownia fortunei]|nr:hypothetical protein Pfo_021971 [Paulownia fortunei]
MSNVTCTLPFLILSFAVSSSALDNLSKGSYLSVEKPEQVLISPNGLFFAGFHPVGENAYCFGIWFAKPLCYANCTLLWIANRDSPVNGRLSKFSLREDGNLILTDADQFTSWASNTASAASLQLMLRDNGNLVLLMDSGEVLWQSFDSPTDTLLPGQPLTRLTALISSRSQGNYSSGLYRLFFDDDNVLRLVYDGPETSSIYWPDPWLLSNEAGRSRYNDSRTAVLNSSGYFRSSDRVEFRAADFGLGKIRRLKLDSDGNLRLYSFEENHKTWVVSWQAIFKSCRIHGACGPNSLCSYDPSSGRVCSCLDGFRMKKDADFSLGCEPEFNLPQNKSEVILIKVSQANFYGYNINITRNSSLKMCEEICLELHNCQGFWYGYDKEDGVYSCYPKRVFRNGFYSPGNTGDMYVKMPKNFMNPVEKPVRGKLIKGCPLEPKIESLNRIYVKKHGSESIQILLWVAVILGGLEIICMISVCCFLSRGTEAAMHQYVQIGTGFRRFTYNELKKATKNFSEVIGEGGSGIVYKGVLTDGRVAAVKKLGDAIQGEAEFLAEVSIIGRLNHRNLIEMWGYCAEGKHRLLVCEYMEHGSLAENLSSDAVDWQKRFEIALGTAKGLAYLHDECLEWVLHCDVKPQNILLDSNYQPKVADFGLSKLVNRGGGNDPKFSKIRGTRGYMAPEWIFNLPITCRVDVYSYGVVVLEMVTGKNPAISVKDHEMAGKLEEKRLINWVREMVNGDSGMATWIEQVMGPFLVNGEYGKAKMEQLIRVALNCVEEDRDARPTMSHVVEMLLDNQG